MHIPALVRCAFFLVPRTRLELAQPCDHQPLKLACLPISPPGRQYSLFQVRIALNSNVRLLLGMFARIAFAKVVQNFKP